MNIRPFSVGVGIGVALFVLSLDTIQSAEPYRFKVPLGLDEFIPVPEDNPATPEKIELGRQLFFDKRLSRDHTIACATCHIPEHGFANADRVAIGIAGRRGTRNVPTLLNRAYGKAFFWDGRAKALEEQPLEAILNPKEMDLTREELEKRLNELKELNGLNEGKSYRERFEEVFAQRLDVAEQQASEAGASRYEVGRSSRSAALAQNAAKAIATFVRTLLSGNSAFDRYEHGDPSALSDAAKRGLQVFRGKGNCIACHSGPLLSDEDFHNTGVSWGKQPLDLGRYEVTARRNQTANREFGPTGSAQLPLRDAQESLLKEKILTDSSEPDRGKFKTPTLRNVALTAPYMHDGSLLSLEDVVDFYSKGANPNPNLDREVRPLNLTAEEKADLIAFLKSLSGRAQIQAESK